MAVESKSNIVVVTAALIAYPQNRIIEILYLSSLSYQVFAQLCPHIGLTWLSSDCYYDAMGWRWHEWNGGLWNFAYVEFLEGANFLLESDSLLRQNIQHAVPVDRRVLPRSPVVVNTSSLAVRFQHAAVERWITVIIRLDVIADDFRCWAASTGVQPALWPSDLDRHAPGHDLHRCDLMTSTWMLKVNGLIADKRMDTTSDLTS